LFCFSIAGGKTNSPPHESVFFQIHCRFVIPSQKPLNSSPASSSRLRPHLIAIALPSHSSFIQASHRTPIQAWNHRIKPSSAPERGVSDYISSETDPWTLLTRWQCCQSSIDLTTQARSLSSAVAGEEIVSWLDSSCPLPKNNFCRDVPTSSSAAVQVIVN